MTSSASHPNPCYSQEERGNTAQWVQKIQSAPISLLDPCATNRHLFVAHFLADANARATVWWIDCSQDIETIEDFVQVLLREANVNLAVDQPTEMDSIQEIARTTAAALSAAINGQQTDLLLDNWDAILATNVALFLLEFANYQPASLHILLLAREFDLERWQPLLRSGVAQYLSNIPSEVIQSAETQTIIVAQAFSQGIVYVNGRRIVNWGRKYSDEVQRLFWYILENPTFSLGDASADLLPETPVADGARQIKTLLKRLNTVLYAQSKQPGQSLVRMTGRDVYTMTATVARCYDVEYFNHAWTRSQLSDNRRVWLRQAAYLHRAPYLYRFRDPWIRSRRQTLLNRYASILEQLVRERLETDQPEEWLLALGDALRGIRQQPMREDLYRHAMALYERLGSPRDAVALYNLLVQRVRVISPQTEALYQEILGRMRG